MISKKQLSRNKITTPKNTNSDTLTNRYIFLYKLLNVYHYRIVMNLEIPAITRYIYAHTSLWILFAAALVQQHDIVLCILLTLAFVASVAHWTWYKHNSWLHLLDRILAVSVLSYCFSTAPIQSECMVFVGFSVVCYLVEISIVLTHDLKMVWHLFFRFWAFSACIACAMPYSFKTHFLHTVCYICHIAILWTRVWEQ